MSWHRRVGSHLSLDYPRTVAVTWKAKYTQLPPATAAVFDALCWLVPDPIPERLVTRAWPAAALAVLPPELRFQTEQRAHRLLIPVYDFCLAEKPVGSQPNRIEGHRKLSPRVSGHRAEWALDWGRGRWSNSPGGGPSVVRVA